MRRVCLGTLAILAACGGSRENVDTEITAPEATTHEQRVAVERLNVETQAAWSVAFDAKRLSALHVEGRAAHVLEGVAPEVATTGFLANHRDLFQMVDPSRELSVKLVDVDELAMTHVRMQQMVAGVPVSGAELIAHFAKDGALTTIDTRYVPGLTDFDVNAQIPVDTAVRAAFADMHATDARFDETRISEAPATRLAVIAKLDKSDAPVLAYEISFRGGIDDEPLRMAYTVDAKTGAVIGKFDNLHKVQGTGVGVLGDTKTLEVTLTNGTYTMVDLTRTPNGIKTYTAATNQVSPGTAVSSASMTTWDQTTIGKGAAVDAHFFAGVVYDYYKTAHGRLGIDGANGALISTVHFGAAYNNAFWDGTQMTYGDGDQKLFRAFSAGLDVVGHELTHGVTEKSSALVYQDQSGALNESISDIFGMFVQHFYKPAITAGTWIMGEDIALGTLGRRDFIHPANGQQPANMSVIVTTTQDNGGVHTNSGIPNNAAYLMTMGGTNDVSKIVVPAGIGWDAAAKVWYRSNTKYLTSTSDFAAAARATISSAKDLTLTQREQDIIECSWIATGVLPGPCKAISASAPTDGRADAGAAGSSTTADGGTATGSGTGTGGGSGGATSGSGGTTAGSGTSSGATPSGTTGDGESTPAKTSASRRSSLTAQSTSGCSASSASPAASGANGIETFGLAALVAGAIAFARRRLRRNENSAA